MPTAAAEREKSPKILCSRLTRQQRKSPHLARKLIFKKNESLDAGSERV
jgi:hypothetical protein